MTDSETNLRAVPWICLCAYTRHPIKNLQFCPTKMPDYPALAAVVQGMLAEQARKIERLKRAIGHAAHRNHISDGCDGCREVDAALRATPEGRG